MVGPGIEQPRTFGVFADDMHKVIGRNAVDDSLPALAVIISLEDIWSAVVQFEPLDGDVRGAWLVWRRFNEADSAELGQVRGSDLLPRLASIARDMDKAVV